MLDRAAGPRFYGACSALAFFVNAAKGDGSRRRLQSDQVRLSIPSSNVNMLRIKYAPCE